MAKIGVQIELEGAPQYVENMNNLTKQTKLYAAQMKRVTQELSGASAFSKSINTTKALTQQLDALTNKSDLLSKEIDKEIEKNGELSNRALQLKTQYENLQTEILKVNQALKEEGGLAGAVGKQFEEIGNKMKSLGDSISSVGTDLSAKVTAPITAIGAASVKTAASFESSMSQVAATMGFSVEELQDKTSNASKTMEQLSAFAQEMGKTTAFSASEAAEALNYMALAGYSADQSMAMLPTVLNLAAAGNIDLASASDMVTDAQSALGLSMDETTKMVDEMAKASSKSNTSVAQLGEAMLQIGATASNMSGGTAELATSLGVLADNGIKGAEGGTKLRNMILSLQDAAENGAVQFGDFSIEVYDAEGNFRAISDIMQDVSKGMEGMSQESKDALTSGVFNKQDLAAVNAMLQTSSDRFSELKGEIEGAEGAAQQMADVQLENFEGKVKLLKSALEGVGIQIGEIILPYLMAFVEKLQSALDWFSNLDEGTKKIIVTIAGIVAAVGPILAIVGKVISAIGTISSVIGGFISFLPAIGAAVSAVGGVLTATILPAIGALVAAIIPFLPIIAAVGAAIAAVILVVKNWGDITDWVSEKWAIFTEFISTAINNIGETFKIIWEKINTTILNAKVKILLTVAKLILSIGEKFSELGKMAIQWGKDMMQSFIDGILAKWEALKQTVARVAESIKEFLGFSEPEKGPMKDFNTWPKHMMQNYAHGIENMRYLVQSAVGDVASDVAVLENPIDSQEVYDAIRNGASDATIRLAIGDRELGRVLRDMGVVFSG